MLPCATQDPSVATSKLCRRMFFLPGIKVRRHENVRQLANVHGLKNVCQLKNVQRCKRVRRRRSFFCRRTFWPDKENMRRHTLLATKVSRVAPTYSCTKCAGVLIGETIFVGALYWMGTQWCPEWHAEH